MTNTTTGRTVGLRTVALLAGVFAAAALLVVALGSTAGAQEKRAVDLVLQKTVSPKTVQVGDQQAFTIRIANRGTTRAEAVRMSDPLPSAVRFIRASTSRHVPGSCGIDDRVVVCRLGNLGPGEAVTAKIYVKTVRAGAYTNRAFVSFRSDRTSERDSSDNSDAARAFVEAPGY